MGRIGIVVTSILIFYSCSLPAFAGPRSWCLAWIDNCSQCVRETTSADAVCSNRQYPVGCISGFHCLKVDEEKFDEECEPARSPVTRRPMQCNFCDQTGRCTQLGCPFEIMCIPKRAR
jgi:hypothetical protein